MRRLFIALIASLLLIGFVAPATGAARVAAATAVPKVVVIVGPSGVATNRYRSEAVKAAALARRYTPDVTELYSPNATWPAVKAALQGASLVIYMGHGNGWPSRYRDSLYPPTQNGFGLNPKAGSGDYTHQYFGEGPISKNINLAKDAIVLLNHLCYASGNTEPGLPEGNLTQARQRVDNFAAGFIKAGASAVIAEAYTSPNYMIRTILGTQRAIQTAWKDAPSRNGHAFAFESARSPGYIAQMDPERGASGFSRSIVLKAGLVPADVLRGARGNANARVLNPGIALALTPSLMAAGLTAKEPTLASTLAATTIKYQVPYKVTARKALPSTFMASVRWDPLDAPAPDPTAAAADSAAADGAAADGAAADGAAPAMGPATTPNLGLVTAERIGDVVAPVKVKLTKKTFSFRVATPTAPGRYRLTVTLHDKDGVAFDAATQALLPTLIVRVTGDLDATIVAPASVDVAPGATTSLSLWVANLGRTPWGHVALANPSDGSGATSATSARLTAQWVALGGVDDETQLASAAAAAAKPVDLPPGLAPGDVISADLQLYAPTVEGDYLLILDVLTPERGSLTSNGVEPTIIRVHVAKPSAAPSVTTGQPTDGATPAPADSDATGGPSASPAAASDAPSASPAPSPATTRKAPAKRP